MQITARFLALLIERDALAANAVIEALMRRQRRDGDVFPAAQVGGGSARDGGQRIDLRLHAQQLRLRPRHVPLTLMLDLLALIENALKLEDESRHYFPPASLRSS